MAALASALSGLLLVLALPPGGWWPLGWVALVPLLCACRGRRFILAFMLGLGSTGVTALVASSGALYGDRGAFGDGMWITLGCIMFGFVVSIVTAVFSELRHPQPRHLLGVAALAVLLEFGLLKMLPVTFALTQAPVAAMRMIASVTGIWGVAFALWLVNLLLANALGSGHGVRLHKAALTIPGLFVAGYLWSHTAGKGSMVSVVIVQTESSELPTLARMSGEDPEALAIWPEFAALAAAPGGDTRELRKLSAEKGSPAIVTSFRDDHAPLPHNVAALFWRGEESSRYAKRLLFGSERSMHTPGNRPLAVPWRGMSVGLSICFDSCLPELIRQTAEPAEVRLIALPTIDPPAPYHWIAAMHAAFMPFRAAEVGIPIVRADGFAYSEAVDASGEVIRMLPPGERAEKVFVPLQRRWTAYRSVGDLFLWLCGGMVLLPLVERVKRGVTREARKGRSHD